MLSLYNVSCESDVNFDVTVPLYKNILDKSSIDKEINIFVKDNIKKLYFDADPEIQIPWYSYNLLSIAPNLISALRESYIDFCNEYNINVDINAHATAWYNVVKPYQGIPYHTHTTDKNSYLSGTINTSHIGTQTSFKLPITDEVIVNQNEVLELLMFPQWVGHYVEPHDFQRYSIGFDIYSSKQIEYYKQNPDEKDNDCIKNSIRLFNENT